MYNAENFVNVQREMCFDVHCPSAARKKNPKKNRVQCQKRCQRTTGQNSVNVQCENFVSVQVCKCENISLHNTENFVNVQL